MNNELLIKKIKKTNLTLRLLGTLNFNCRSSKLDEVNCGDDIICLHVRGFCKTKKYALNFHFLWVSFFLSVWKSEIRSIALN